MPDLILPQVNKGDLVLVVPDRNFLDRIGGDFTRYKYSSHPILFYSDGRTALTDIDYSNPNTELNKLPDPERGWCAAEMNLYKVWNLISREIDKGKLQDYSRIFGRDEARGVEYSGSWSKAVKPSIVYQGPLALFGYEKEKGSLRLDPPREASFSFNNRRYNFKLPKPVEFGEISDRILGLTIYTIQRIVVGYQVIGDILKGTPLEIYVNEGIIQR